MKKYLFSATISLILGITLSYFILNQYDIKDTIKVSLNSKKIYFIGTGVYTTKEKMKNKLTKLEYYIYDVEDNLYYAYIGITNTKENAKKIRNAYKNYDTYIREKNIKNNDLTNTIDQYDQIIKNTNNLETIKTIENKILSKYKEILND